MSDYTAKGLDDSTPRLVVCGTRTFDNVLFVRKKLNELTTKLGKLVVVVGDADGPDFIAEKWALLKGFAVVKFRADWSKFSKSAGPRRNAEMIGYAKCHKSYFIAFWDGVSDGTGDCIDRARRVGLKIRVVKVRSRPKLKGWRK